MADDDPKKSSALEDDNDDDLFYDPLDEFEFTDEDLRNVLSSPSPNLFDLNLPTLEPPPTLFMGINETQLMHELSLSITECDNDDYIINWDMYEPSNHDDFDNNIDLNVLGEIGNDNNGNTIVGETISRLEVSTRVLGNTNGPNFETGGPSTMHVPVTPTISDGSFVCPCCTLLRELVHTNGQYTNRLTIYGGIGLFCHAILETQRFVGDIERQYQTFHLKDLAMEDVRKFIEDYCSQTQYGGLSLVEDTNSAFYQAMNVNSISNQSLMVPVASHNDVPMALPTPDEALTVPPVPPQDEPTTSSRKGKGKRKTPLALQRERTAKMTVKDLSMHFHIPIERAARKLRLCPTVLKKICRKGGLMRWPHRKIKCIEDKIARLENVVRTAKNNESKTRAQQQIENLRKNIADICSDILKNFDK